MALQITKTLDFQVDVTYWRIVRIDAEYRPGKHTVHVGGYVSAAARQKADAAVVVIAYEFPDAMPTGAVLANVYAELKTLPDFLDAVDV